MKIISCNCGILLDLDSEIEKHCSTMFHHVVCPVCKYKIEI
jgi:hypothetical protein